MLFSYYSNIYIYPMVGTDGRLYVNGDRPSHFVCCRLSSCTVFTVRYFSSFSQVRTGIPSATFLMNHEKIKHMNEI